MKQLTATWLVQSNTDLPIYEDWQIVNDTLLKGIWYRISEDTTYLPEAGMTLLYSNNKITINCAYPGKDGQAGTILTFSLNNIEQGVYYFENTADTLSIGAKKELKATFLSSIVYDCSKKDRITAQRMYIVPGKGLSTVRYVFKKDAIKKSTHFKN
ncbi:MAG: hypothetical protein EOP54_04835 [Sphingobacteriales bacterium]|nr:MAG: hypothetical protein EOP54_04835 [Sphingobacteriales bacterium]